MSQLELILGRLAGVKPATDGNMNAHCPCSVHKKVNNKHLYLKDAGDKVVIHCQAGCSAMEVLYEIELELKDLYPPSSEADKQTYRNQVAIKREQDHEYQEAFKFWVELCVIKQTLEARLFGDDKHPENITELWGREKEATRMMPKYFKQYYNFK